MKVRGHMFNNGDGTIKLAIVVKGNNTIIAEKNIIVKEIKETATYNLSIADKVTVQFSNIHLNHLDMPEGFIKYLGDSNNHIKI